MVRACSHSVMACPCDPSAAARSAAAPREIRAWAASESASSQPGAGVRPGRDVVAGERARQAGLYPRFSKKRAAARWRPVSDQARASVLYATSRINDCMNTYWPRSGLR